MTASSAAAFQRHKTSIGLCCVLAITLLAASPPPAWSNVVINEFVAANTAGLLDEDGDYSDWIELRNDGTAAVSLNGWSLSDDAAEPAKWRFPALTLAPGGYLIIFASNKDRAPVDGSELHANFRLSREGEYLGLFDAAGTLKDALTPQYPEQAADVSYGRRLNQTGWWYLDPPTPGAANTGGSAYASLTASPQLSLPRGFYKGAIQLTISAAVPSTKIWYTLDGTAPVPSSSPEYAAPIKLTESAVIRVQAQAPNARLSPIVTSTYLLDVASNVKSLPAISIAGDPGESLYEPNGIMAIVGGTYLWAPDFSWISLEESDYNNPMQRGEEFERPASVEFLEPYDNTGFQADCGIRVHGSDFHRARYRRGSDWLSCDLPDLYNKFSFKLYFRDEYGDDTLKYPIFPKPSQNRSACVVLRGGHNDICAPFVTDELFRRLHYDMGYPEAIGSFATLFLNGQYKGLYNPSERIDEDFLREIYGKNTDWDVITRRGDATGEPRDGSTEAWNAMMSDALNNLLSEDVYYQKVAAQIDLVSFIDFLIIELYSGNTDWPNNNWIAARDRAHNGKFMFFVWDTEQGMTSESLAWNGFYSPGGGLNYQERPIAQLFQALKRNPNFRQLFADRVQTHFFGNGALVNDNIMNRFLELRAEVLGIFPASDSFIVDTFIPQRRDIVLQQFAQEGLYPLAPLELIVNGQEQFGGSTARGARLSITNPSGSGTVYYTLDGTDPRQTSTWSADFTTLIPESAPKRVLSPTVFNEFFSFPNPFNYALIQSSGTIDHFGQTSATDPTAAQSLFSDTSQWANVQFGTTYAINYLNTGNSGHFGDDASFPGLTIGEDKDNFALFVTGHLFIPAAGYWVFGVHCNDGFKLDIGEHTMTFDGTREAAEDALSLFIFDEAGVYDFFFGYFDHTGDADVELFAAPGYHTEFNADAFHLVGDVLGGGLGTVSHWADNAFDDSAWTQGQGGVGYDTNGGFESLIGTDVSSMQGVNSTCLIRIPFSVTANQIENANLLVLNVRYSAGFVAYLNGSEVAHANAPATPQWNSAAAATRTAAQAINVQQFDITRWKSSLNAGENLLAIQAMTAAPDSPDLLLSTELLAGVEETTPGQPVTGALQYASPLTLTNSVHLMARVYDDGLWGPLTDVTFSVGDLETCLKISEIMYNPAQGFPEFLEFQNTCAYTIDLSNASFTDGINFSFPPYTFITAGQRFVLTNTPDLFAAQYPGTAVLGAFSGALDNNGEKITLKDAQKNTILSFTYHDDGQWPEDADGEGASLVAVDGAGDPDDAAYWRASLAPGGSPGREDTVSASAIYVNEALPLPEAPQMQAIELYNPNTAPVDIRGWFLSDVWSEPRKARIPSANQYIVPARGYVVLAETVFADTPGEFGLNPLPGFTLDPLGETGLFLFSADTSGNLTGFVHGFGLEPAETGVTQGRYLTSTGEERFVPQSAPTLGAQNAGPKAGPVVISEIYYNPLPGEIEYLELTNITAQETPLYAGEAAGDATAAFVLDGIGFRFPPDAALPAGGKLVVANANALLFRNFYKIPERIAVFGPFGNSAADGLGALSDTGETVALRWPQTFEPAAVAFVAMDKVHYETTAPWPSANGNGMTLRRKSLTAYGNDPVNWAAAEPSYLPGGVEEGEEEGEEGEEEGEQPEEPNCFASTADINPPKTGGPSAGFVVTLLSAMLFMGLLGRKFASVTETR